MCGGIGWCPAGGRQTGGRDRRTMDWNDIERLRIHGFTVARRGYDRREVDKFLGALVDWLETDAPKDLGGMAVKRKFELAGKSTAQILLTTEKESEQMLRQAEEECADLRAQAEAASREAREGRGGGPPASGGRPGRRRGGSLRKGGAGGRRSGRPWGCWRPAAMAR